jgi:hypothetical protein
MTKVATILNNLNTNRIYSTLNEILNARDTSYDVKMFDYVVNASETLHFNLQKDVLDNSKIPTIYSVVYSNSDGNNFHEISGITFGREELLGYVAVEAVENLIFYIASSIISFKRASKQYHEAAYDASNKTFEKSKIGNYLI